MEIMPDMTFRGHQIRMWKSPLVYVLRDEEDRALYVGMSTRGIGRPFSQDHHAISHTTNEHRIDVYYCRTKHQAMDLERKLILELKPSRNKTASRGKRNDEDKGLYITEQRARVFVRIDGVLRTKSFPLDTPKRVMRAWRDEQRKLQARQKVADGLQSRLLALQADDSKGW